MINEVLQQHFPSLNNFKELTDKIAHTSTRHSFSAGETILREGQYVKVIPLLISGLVKVFKEDDSGNEVLLYYIKPGESCVMSMTALIKNNKSKVKGVVEEEADILVLPADEVLKIAKNFPQWNEFIYELFNSKYEELLHVIGILTFSNKDRRVLEYLNKQCQLKNSRIIKKTHQDIADDLGSSREVISRILKKLENEKKLELRQGEVLVLAES